MTTVEQLFGGRTAVVLPGAVEPAVAAELRERFARAGYTRYALADTVWSKLSLVPRPLRRAAAGLATLPSPALYDGVAGPLLPLLPERHRHARVGDKVHKAAHLLSMQSLDEVYLHLCSHWTDPASIVTGGREPPTMLTGLEQLPRLPGNVERMMYLDLKSYLPDDILVKVDRAAMAVSLERGCRSITASSLSPCRCRWRCCVPQRPSGRCGSCSTNMFRGNWSAAQDGIWRPDR